MVSIALAVNQIKEGSLRILTEERIAAACEKHGHVWRDTPLNPANLVGLFLRQVAQGNISCEAIRHFSGEAFTASAYCQARGRLPLEVFQTLMRETADALAAASSGSDYRWKGHRTFHIDGSAFSMPDTAELQEVFGQPGQQEPGCGFPVAHLLALFNAKSGLILDAIASPLRTHDMSQASKTHGHLQEGDVLIGDRAFGTYAHFALLLQGNRHGLFPAHQKRIIDFKPHRAFTRTGQNKGMTTSRWIRSLGKTDQLVEWFKPQAPPAWMTAEQHRELPDSIIVREARRTLRRKGFRPVTLTIVTTLLDPEVYPAEDLFELRLRRWDVETNLRHLKITMKMDVLKCESVDGVRKELAVFAMVYNLVRTIMMRAAGRQGVDVGRISFADALAWLRQAGPDSEPPNLVVNPLRPNRIEPRANKRRHKEYDRMNKPRDDMRKALKNKGKST